jgi:SAM-dependent methyltransferase
MGAISLNEIQELWKFNATQEIREIFEEIDTRFENVSDIEKDELILDILRILNSPLRQSGSDRIQEWEDGWNENYKQYIESGKLLDLFPKYFNKYPIIRWRQEFIKPKDGYLEANLLRLLILVQITKLESEFTSIYEFGCGTGHNLVALRELYPDIKLVGLDWATSSQRIIQKIASMTRDNKLVGLNFDYFHPNMEIKLPSDSIVLTVASLEQTGSNFEKFIEYLVENKPKKIIHIEPIWESLQDENLIDHLSVAYMKKRNYLNGFITYLHSLENKGIIRIIEYNRSYLGSKFIDGYTTIIWELT